MEGVIKMKCPVCKVYLKNKKSVITHMNASHYDKIPEQMSASKYYYSLNHAGSITGKCRICSDPTDFDEATGRVKMLCKNPKCKQAFAKIAQDRNIKKFGVPHLLNDQQHQMKMLSKRKISGEYIWSDHKGKVPYVGSYERRFLEFLDNFLDFDPNLIHAPCPITIYYEYEGETLSNTPDYYIDILDLIVEIKHGGKNPNNHPKIQKVDVAKDKAKEKALKEKTRHNYIKIVDNDFSPFIHMMFKLTEQEQYGTKERIMLINESDADKLDIWLYNIEHGYEAKYGISDYKDLYFLIYGTEEGLKTGDVDVYASTSDSEGSLIHYKNDKLQYVDGDELDKIKSSYICTYKYISDQSIQTDMKKLFSIIEEGKIVDALSSVDAFAKIFTTIFDKKNNYSVLDVILNTDLVNTRDKYTGIRQLDTQFIGLLN